MRYSMIIVDDEFYSRNGITKLIDWKSFNIDIVGLAESGKEGIELINRLRPDIVLSDIRMNGMSGLEMIEQLRKSGCTSRFVLISGYREFEYARKAIEQRVISYLLKPVDKDELIKVIDKVIASINSEQESGIFKEIEKHEQEARSLLENRSDKNICSVCIVRDDSCFALESKIRLFREVNQRLADCVCSFRDDEFFVVFSPKPAHYTAVRVAECFEDTPMCGAAEAEKDMAESYDNAKTALWSGLYADGRCVSFYEETVNMLSDKSADELFAGETSEIIQLIELANTKQCFELINDIFDRIKEIRLHPSELYRWLRKILNTISNTADKMKIPAREYLRNDGEKVFSEKIFTVDSIDNIRRLLISIIGNLDNYMEEKIRMNSTRGIKLIKMYIDEHYMEDISLKDLEKLFYTELSYLSKLFKKETGMNYLKYITEKRIGKAKELLKNPDLTVAQVASMVSYTDARYFGQLFKKVVGMTVTEYRSGLYKNN